MLTFLFIFSIVTSIGYAVLSRMCGGGYYHLPYGLDQWLYAIPYGILGTLSGLLGFGFSWWLIPSFIFSFGLAFLGKRTGHGQWMDLGTWTKKVTAEKMDFLVALIWGIDKNTQEDNVKGSYWRDWTGLTVNGLFTGLGTAVLVGTLYSVLLGTLIAVGAAAKGVAYSAGWFVNGKPSKEVQDILGKELDEATELGEFLTGFFAGLPLFFTLGLTLMTLLGYN